MGNVFSNNRPERETLCSHGCLSRGPKYVDLPEGMFVHRDEFTNATGHRYRCISRGAEKKI